MSIDELYNGRQQALGRDIRVTGKIRFYAHDLTGLYDVKTPISKDRCITLIMNDHNRPQQIDTPQAKVIVSGRLVSA